MSIQPRLPTELLEAVIDEASDNPRTLRSLSLTCITLLPRSRARLFSGLVIRTVQQLEASPEFLDSCPWLPPLVRKISLFVTIPEDNDKPHIRLLDVVPIHLFTRLPNLCAWTMETEYSSFPNVIPSLALHHSALRCYRIYGGHIRSLELSRIRFHSESDFRGLIMAFTSLDSLTCDNIKFYSSKQEPIIAATVTTNTRPLPISTLTVSLLNPSIGMEDGGRPFLKIGTSMDRWAVEYLLACSASKLKHLTIQLREDDFIDGSLDLGDQWGELPTQFPPLSLLVLIISGSRLGMNDEFALPIRFATKILAHVNRDYLTDVRVEFQADPLAILGARISGAGASLEACKQFEEALLTFPTSAVLVHDPVLNRRVGRTKLWSPIIRGAFSGLDKQGLLTLRFRPSKEDAPDPVGHEEGVACVVISHDSTRAITSSYDGTIIIWDIAGGAVLHEWLAHQGSRVKTLALSPDSIRLVSSGRHALAIWDMGDGSPMKVAKLEGHTDEVNACTWSPDGMLIASASSDGTVRIWNGHTYEQRDLVPAHPHSELPAAHSLQFSPNTNYLAWISSNIRSEGNCFVWRPLMGEQPKILPLHPDGGHTDPRAVSFDCESQRIATAHGNKNDDPDACVVRIWDAATLTPIAVLAGHSKPVRSVSFSSDGRSLLSVAEDMSMWVWDCGIWSGKQTSRVRDSDSPVEHRRWCVRHDRKYVATGSNKCLVQLWRVSDGECVATFDEHDSFVHRIEFSPNGQFLISGYSNGIVRIHCLSRFITE